jgi:Domain of unknown function (DUF4436)
MKKVWLFAAVAIVSVVALTSVVALSMLQSGRISIESIGASPAEADRVNAVLLVRDVDTARQEAKFRLYLEPSGRFADSRGRFAQAIQVDSSNEAAGGVLVAEKGSTTLIDEFISTFQGGDEVAFPLDRYESTIWLAATLENGEPVPMRVRFEAADSAFRYSVSDSSTETQAATGQVGFEPTIDLVVERSGLTKTVATVIIILMWAIAVAVAAVTWLALARQEWRQRSFEILAWHAALLFALIQLRGTTPGIPGFGTLFDFVGFFWAELIVAISLCIVVAVLVQSQTRRGSPGNND